MNYKFGSKVGCWKGKQRGRHDTDAEDKLNTATAQLKVFTNTLEWMERKGKNLSTE